MDTLTTVDLARGRGTARAVPPLVYADKAGQRARIGVKGRTSTAMDTPAGRITIITVEYETVVRRPDGTVGREPIFEAEITTPHLRATHRNGEASMVIADSTEPGFEARNHLEMLFRMMDFIEYVLAKHHLFHEAASPAAA